MKRVGWLALALAGAAIVVHLAALDVPFVYDDTRTVSRNVSLQGDLSQALRYERYRPLTNLSYYADAAVWGVAEPWGFHLTALALHGLVVALLFLVAHDGGRGRGAALAAGLLAVHPLGVQSVGYISGRAGLWVALGLLGGLLAYRRAVRSGRAVWLLGVLACWLLAAAGKETGAVLPALLLLHDLLLADDPGRGKRVWRLHAPALGMLALGASLRLSVYVGQERGAAHGLESVLTQLGVSWRAVRLALVPLDLSIVHLVPLADPRDPALWLRILALAGLALGAWRLRRRAPRLAFGLGAWLVLLGPTTLVPLDEHFAEQRTYVPGLALALVAGELWGLLAARLAASDPRTRPVLGVAAAIWLLGLAGVTQLRYRVWRDPLALWTEAVTRAGPAAPTDPRLRHSPVHAVPYNNLGVALLGAGRLEDAVRRLDEALTLRPDYTEAYSNRGAARWAQGDIEGALADYERALALNPNNAMAATNRGMLRAQRGDLDGALADYDHALRLFPRLGLARAARGKVLERLARWEQAAADFAVAREEAPEVPGGWLGGARVALARDRPEEALQLLTQARERLPAERETIDRGIAHCRKRLAER